MGLTSWGGEEAFSSITHLPTLASGEYSKGNRAYIYLPLGFEIASRRTLPCVCILFIYPIVVNCPIIFFCWQNIYVLH